MQNKELLSYTASDSGYITFPYLGEVPVKNMNLTEAKYLLEDLLTKYIVQPIVIVKFLNKSFTVLGEVKRPGNFVMNSEQINILEAIGLAGDLTDYANRNKITIMREENDTVTFEYIDVTDRNVINSEFYYLRPNDIVYVEPLKAKFWGIKPSAPETIMTYISFLSALLSVAILLKLN